MGDLALTDLDGRVHKFARRPDRNGLLFVFLGTECPISNRYLPQLSKLAADVKARGVALFGVISTPDVTRAAARAHRDEYAIGFPVLFDGSGVLATRLGPTHVPEAFAFGRDGRLVYRGAIDDRWVALGRARTQLRDPALANVADGLASGTAPAFRRTTPIGCMFEAWRETSTASDVTWTRDIAPIIRGRCTDCHHANGPAPFSLERYADVRKRARFVARLTAKRIMPPWKAAPGYGRFRNSMRLTEREIALIRRWADAGAPEGPAADRPPKRIERPRWRLGPPDLILRPDNPLTIPARGLDHLRDYVVPIDLDEDRIVTAIEYHPGAPRSVHHAIFALNYRMVDGHALMDPIGGYAPGAELTMPPEPGMGTRLRKRSTFAMLTHYFPRGKKEVDRWEVGLYFAKRPVKRIVRWLPLGSDKLDIPAGDAKHEVRLTMPLPVAVTVYKLFPHFHLLAREMKLRAVKPDGTIVPLVWIRDWDMHWQQMYVLDDPVRLPAGSRFEFYTRYDNSAGNPQNPHRPPVRVTQGGDTLKEMCECYVQVTTASDDDFDRLVPHVMVMRTGMALEQAERVWASAPK